jgi:hypothetical protein
MVGYPSVGWDQNHQAASSRPLEELHPSCLKSNHRLPKGIPKGPPQNLSPGLFHLSDSVGSGAHRSIADLVGVYRSREMKDMTSPGPRRRRGRPRKLAADRSQEEEVEVGQGEIVARGLENYCSTNETIDCIER